MRLTQAQLERRVAAGLPVTACPNCGKYEAHWVADRLGENGLVEWGYFTCEVAS